MKFLNTLGLFYKKKIDYYAYFKNWTRLHDKYIYVYIYILKITKKEKPHPFSNVIINGVNKLRKIKNGLVSYKTEDVALMNLARNISHVLNVIQSVVMNFKFHAQFFIIE